MDNNDIRKLCLKQVYGAALTAAERASVDDYAQTADGMDYLRESREMKALLQNIADVKIKPVDHEEMVEDFERTVRQKLQETLFRPWWEANSPRIVLRLMAGVFIVLDGWTVINSVLLGSCVLWLISDYLQRYYFTRTLSRPDLYGYAKASKRRSDRILQSLLGHAMVALLSVLVIAAVSFGA